jgi:hypothetical protein
MATDNTEQIASQPNYLEPQNTQQSETPQLAQTLVDLYQTMSHMAMMLGETLGGIITMLALHGRIFSSEENRTTRGKKVQNTNHLTRNNRSLKDNKFICFSSK